MRLANKVAIVTGAASGIGRASAILFAKEGAKVVVADINDAGGEETVAIIKSGHIKQAAKMPGGCSLSLFVLKNSKYLN